MTGLIANIKQWAHDRNIINGATVEGQVGKLDEEVQELKDSLKEGKSPIDDIGDITVVLIILAEMKGLSFEECLLYAYKEIKDRKGKIIGGKYVKEV